MAREVIPTAEEQRILDEGPFCHRAKWVQHHITGQRIIACKLFSEVCYFPRPDKPGCKRCRFNTHQLPVPEPDWVTRMQDAIAEGIPPEGNSAREVIRAHMNKAERPDMSNPEVRDFWRGVVLAAVARGLAPHDATAMAVEEGMVESE